MDKGSPERDLDERLADLHAKTINIRATTETEFVGTAIVDDLDGNQLVFAQSVGDRIERSSFVGVIRHESDIAKGARISGLAVCFGSLRRRGTPALCG